MIGWRAYQKLLDTGKYKRISTKPARFFHSRAQFTIVASDGELLEKPLPQLARKMQIAGKLSGLRGSHGK